MADAAQELAAGDGRDPVAGQVHDRFSVVIQCIATVSPGVGSSGPEQAGGRVARQHALHREEALAVGRHVEGVVIRRDGSHESP